MEYFIDYLILYTCYLCQGSLIDNIFYCKSVHLCQEAIFRINRWIWLSLLRLVSTCYSQGSHLSFLLGVHVDHRKRLFSSKQQRLERLQRTLCNDKWSMKIWIWSASAGTLRGVLKGFCSDPSASTSLPCFSDTYSSSVGANNSISPVCKRPLVL